MPDVWEESTEYTTLAAGALVPSPTNPRKTFPKPQLEELAATIRKKGILQPLLVRPKNGAFEVVFGERRRRAAELAGLKVLPVRIRELTDAEVLELQIIENVQRQDVAPLEEGEGYRSLRDRLGYDVEAIAEKTGKSASYVYQRLKLTELGAAARRELAERKITAGHAILLARLTAAHQAKALGQLRRNAMSVRQLQEWIAHAVHRDLRQAPFPQSDAELLREAGACTTCPKRAGNSPALYPKTRPDTCTDGDCFERKLSAHVGREIERAAAAGAPLVQIALGYGETPKGVLNPDRYTTIPNKDYRCEHTRKAIILQGHRMGQKIEVCIHPGCRQHRSPRSAVETPAVRAKRLERERGLKLEAAVRLEVLAAIVEAAPERLAAQDLRAVALAVWNRWWNDAKREIAKRRGWQPVKEQYSQDWEAPAKAWLAKASDRQVIGFLFELALNATLSPGYAYPGAGVSSNTEGRKTLLEWAKRLRVPAERIERQVRAAAKEKTGSAGA